ncbi:hypothetical protein LOTGIDRAFT_111202, partial [Lottia gigantea]
IQGNVPGDVYTSLIQSRIIEDPYRRDNDVVYRPYAYYGYTYNRKFTAPFPITVSEADFKSTKIELVCDGLDTFSDIMVNGVLVGSSDNMFIKYRYNIKHVIKPGINNITISFQSAVITAEALYNKSTYHIPSICPDAYHGFCHYNFIRKMEYSFSWDWGPAIPNQGIWRNIYVECYDIPKINSISVLPKQSETGLWMVDVDVYFDVTSTPTTGQLKTIIEPTLLPKQILVVQISSNTDHISYKIIIPQDHPLNLWWPRGYGNQDVYNLTATLTLDDSPDISTKTKQIGFRTVELVRDPVSSDKNLGNTFYFRINGVPIFMKGANWVPPDTMLERITRDKIENILQSVIEGNMNLLTVSGVSIYEDDYFYELTNNLGIMVLEDLMFCDALYPVDQNFLDSVKIEVTQQVRRIKNHPSIIAWVFNNEDEILINQNWLHVTDMERFRDDYRVLFRETLAPIITSEDLTRPRIVSSPSNGQSDIMCNNCQSELNGDVHFYDYISDLWNINNFPTPRFASEYGLISWCDPETLEPVIDKSDMDFFSPIAQHRTHHPNGTQQMYDEIKAHFTLPTTTDNVTRFQHMIYLSQINHAMMMRYMTEHYRRSQNNFDPSSGKGHTMGSIFWFLADVWQAPTWASIDFNQKWKMLHYYAKKFFNSTIVSPHIYGTNLSIDIVNDELAMLEERDPLTNQLKFRLNQTSGCIFEKNVDDILSEAGCTDKKNCFLYFYLNSRDNPTSTSWLPLSYFTDVQAIFIFQISNVKKMSPTEFTVTLTTNHIAPFVWINSRGISGRFSDNGFIMKDPQLQLIFTSWQPVDLKTFTNSLSVQSLMDIYH